MVKQETSGDQHVAKNMAQKVPRAAMRKKSSSVLVFKRYEVPTALPNDVEYSRDLAEYQLTIRDTEMAGISTVGLKKKITIKSNFNMGTNMSRQSKIGDTSANLSQNRVDSEKKLFHLRK